MLLDADQALGLLIDTLPGYSKKYGSIFCYFGDSAFADYGQTIKRFISKDGSTSEHSFAIGGNYSNKLYFGLTMGLSRIYYISHYEHLETAGKITPYGFNDFNYVFHYENTGRFFVSIYTSQPTLYRLAFHTPCFTE